MIEIRYKFTDKELKQALNNLTILVDTREQKNEHILDAFNKLKVNYKVQKLDFGDYSCFIPKGSFEGQARDIYFTNDIAIERKASIDELAGNLKDDATRIRTELAHINKYNIKCYLFTPTPILVQGLVKGELDRVSTYIIRQTSKPNGKRKSRTNKR